MDRHRSPLSGRGAALLALPPLIFVALFFVWPVVNILALGIAPDGALATGALVDAWTQPFVIDVVLFTLGLALASTLSTLLLGLPPAWVFARFDFPFKSAARALTVVPFVLPTVVVGSAFLALGISGSVVAILIAHVFYNVAVVIRLPQRV